MRERRIDQAWPRGKNDQMTCRRGMAATAVALVVLLVGLRPVIANDANDATFVGSIEPGQAISWEGPFVERGTASEKDCETEPSPCFDYALRLGSGGARLRVALDLLLGHPVHDTAQAQGRMFRIQIIRPDGEPAIAGNSFYSVERFVCFDVDDDPTAETDPCRGRTDHTTAQISSEGTWVIRVVPHDVDRWAFRVRAFLGDDHDKGPNDKASGSSGRALPNLRAVPPFEFTFVAPVVSLAAVGGGTDPTGRSCLADERMSLSDPDARCLRFSTGPENTGDGHVDLRGNTADADATGLVPAYQRVYKITDGWVEPDRRAGWLRFDDAHGHWHYEGFMTYELLRVAEGGVVPLGTSRKQGFCPADERLAGWDAYFQDANWQFERDTNEVIEDRLRTCLDPARPLMGLTSGWGDIYEWLRPEQFVEFPAEGDGDYVIRATADEDGTVLESDENDNASYAHVRVAGDAITILERGYGTDPFDPAKEVVVTRP